jgi:hypothetical protein
MNDLCTNFERNKILKKINKPTVIMIGFFILFFILIGYLIYYGNQYTEHRYTLSEIDDGVYAVYYNTYSRVPAQNYEVITVCCEGNIYTFKGDVYISFTDTDPYIKVKSFNIVNSDEIYVYIPKNTLSYEEGINIGR